MSGFSLAGVVKLLEKANNQNVNISFLNDELSVQVQKGVKIDSSLLEELKENKPFLIHYFKNFANKEYKPDLPPIQKTPRTSGVAFPLSYSQERLWFIDQLEGSSAYHLPTVLRLRGQLNTNALQAALAAIVERHEVLRTIFQEQNGQVYQSVKENSTWQLQLVDGIFHANNPDVLKAYIETLVRTPFDLSHDFPVRATLIQLTNEEHVLAVTIHHIVSDAWSVSTIVQELVEFYDAFASGRQPVLAPLPLQYADYAVWQRNYLQGNVLDNKIAYWKEKLDGVEALQLPAITSRSAEQSAGGGNFSFHIEKETAEGLYSLCRQQGVTLFMALLSVYKVLLYRYSGQQDICVGTSLASRQQQELEGLIGFFVNTLALRDELNPDASFVTLLQQVRTTTLDAYEHQDVPFEKVVEAVVKERDPGRSPLFQVMLVLANTPAAAELRLGEVVLSQEAYEQEIAKFDITFFINQAADGLYGSVQYAAGLYSAATIEQMAEHFVTLVSSVIINPQQKTGLLPMLSSKEEDQILQSFNVSQVAYPTAKSIVDLFEEQAAKVPRQTALVFEDNSLTYAQLNERSNQLAHYLKSKGVAAGDLLPLYMERSADMMIGLLGILKAGAAYVPIDTGLPADRIRYLLQDTAAKIIVSHAQSSTRLEAETSVHIIDIDDAVNQSTDNLTEKPAATDLAYVIYTSGSTGQPKGVMIAHRSLADYYYGLDQQVHISNSKSFALVSTIATDLGNTVIFGSLLSGGALHVFSKESVSNIEYLHRYFQQHTIDCLKIVPSHWKALSTADEALLLPKQLLIFGGEALPSEAVAAIQQAGSTCQVVNHYGPTETTIGKLLHQVQPASKYSSTIPIGKPFSNTTVYVLSKELQLCPVGVPGQLYISGDGLASGYLNNEELTQSKFVPNPFTIVPPVPANNHQENKESKEDNNHYSRMYATGDQVKWNADGNIQFIGRVDDQVKIRGYRVEPGEVTSVLLQHTDVKTAVVLASPDKQGNNRLVAYIVPSGYFDTAEKASIIAYLKEELPDYMVPAVLVEIAAMPLTANGKIDRRALPDADATEQESGGYTAPRNETEAKLAAIWGDVLEEEEVSIHADFFELGGHSLLAVRLVSAIRKAFEVEMPIGDIFDYPTVALLATRLSQQASAPLQPTITVIQPRPERIPLSYSQERLWFIDQLGGSLQYHIPSVVRLSGQLDVVALANALQEIVSRHEVLRTFILEEDGTPYQVIKETEGWHLQTSDGSTFDSTTLSAYLQHYISQPFDLATSYPLRAVLIHLKKEVEQQDTGYEEYVLAVVLHHIASDGYSTPVMVQELVELYNASIEQRLPSLPLLPVQYADYALWQRSYLQGDVLAEKLHYWAAQLQAVATLQLPADYPRPPVQSTRGAITSFQIDKALSHQLQAFSQQQGVTMFMTLLATFNVLLYRYSGQTDICVGTPTAGREQTEVEGLIGFFINTLALRSQVEGSQPFIQLLEQVKAMTLAAYEHQQVPFEKVVEAVVKERDMSRSPLFQVMLVLQNTPEVAELKLNGLSVSAGVEGLSTHHSAKFDLTFNLTETAEGLYLAIEYSTELYRQESIERMAAHYINLLQSAVTAPRQSLGTLPMLSQGEEQALLQTFNDTKTTYPKDKTIVDLLEEQVEKTPDSIAIVFEEQSLTYRELNERSNQLAHYLREKGIIEETLVPICIERSVEMMVGIVGILKAGGAYVPIDPRYPEDRIRYMLEDTAARVVVSSRESSQKLGITAGITAGIATGVEVIEIDGHWDVISRQPAGNLSVGIMPASLAYVIYTSGSTGRPKGVLIEHGNVVSLITGTDYVTLTNQDILLSTGSFSFDATTFEYWSMLLHGGQLVLCTESKLLNHQFLKEEINNRGVSLMWFTSSWFNQLVETDISLFATLRTVLVGGEKLSEYHIEKFRQTYPAIALINGYGPTENTTFSLTHRVIETSITQPIPIGSPLSNRTVLILDAYQQLVPAGVAGEICLGGAGLARGYLNNEALTKEKFIHNPFSQQPGARLYKTGDIGRQSDDGTIDYMGRRDEQVKIRGYRIELGEIENVLQQHEAVKQTVVVIIENKDGRKQLVAYVVKANEVFAKEDIITHISRRLPAYMIPSVWMEIDKIPLTANGKVDKKALPEVDIREVATNAYEAPRNETEMQLAQVWEQLLGISQVGVHDNFFELGGDSVLTIQVVNRAKRMGFDIQTRDMFAYQTIARLSEAISNRSTLIVSGEQGLLTGGSGLLPIQQWYLEESGDLSVSHFNQTVIVGIDKAISSAMLNTALQQLIWQHDALRFKYYKKEGEWHQEYGTYMGNLITEDLRKVKKQRIASVITEKANTYQASLNIENGELLRMVWMQTPAAEKQNRLLIVIHHLVIDGVSWRILIENLEFLLTGLQNNELLELGDKSSSYRQWYQALQQYGQGQSVVAQIIYWEKVLGSYQPLIVGKQLDEKAQAKNISSVTSSLETEHTTRLIRDVPKVYHTEINDILLCALAITLRDWGGINKVIVGLEGHGREEIAKNIDISQTVGWFTSLYPVLIETGVGQHLTESIQSVKKQLRLVPDKGLGFGVLKYINKEKRLAKKPRWNIVFNYLGQLDTIVQEGKLFGGASESAGQSMSDDQQVNEHLSVNSFIRGGELILTWNYNNQNSEKNVITDLTNIYKENLEMLIEHCVDQQNAGTVDNSQDEADSTMISFEKGNGVLQEINYKYLIPIRSAGSKVPLYIVAGGGGTAHKFMKFSKMLDPDQPVYILQAPDDAKSLRRFPDTIEKMAAVFLEEVLLHYPQGPYALSGHCTGGLIAYEMARQLKAKGRRVRMLAMFDTIARRSVTPVPANIKNLYHIPAYLRNATSKTILKFDFEVFLLRKYARKAIGYKIRSLKKILEKPEKFSHENQMDYINMGIFGEASDIYVAAHRKYEINVYDGNVVAFYAKDRYYFSDVKRNIRYKRILLSDQVKNMWQEFTTEATIYDVEGDHSEMFGNEWGDEFARRLQYHLDNGKD